MSDCRELQAVPAEMSSLNDDEIQVYMHNPDWKLYPDCNEPPMIGYATGPWKDLRRWTKSIEHRFGKKSAETSKLRDSKILECIPFTSLRELRTVGIFALEGYWGLVYSTNSLALKVRVATYYYEPLVDVGYPVVIFPVLQLVMRMKSGLPYEDKNPWAEEGLNRIIRFKLIRLAEIVGQLLLPMELVAGDHITRIMSLELMVDAIVFLKEKDSLAHILFNFLAHVLISPSEYTQPIPLFLQDNSLMDELIDSICVGVECASKLEVAFSPISPPRDQGRTVKTFPRYCQLPRIDRKNRREAKDTAHQFPVQDKAANDNMLEEDMDSLMNIVIHNSGKMRDDTFLSYFNTTKCIISMIQGFLDDHEAKLRRSMKRMNKYSKKLKWLSSTLNETTKQKRRKGNKQSRSAKLSPSVLKSMQLDKLNNLARHVLVKGYVNKVNCHDVAAVLKAFFTRHGHNFLAGAINPKSVLDPDYLSRCKSAYLVSVGPIDA